MKVRFHLTAEEREIGTLVYDWKSPYLPQPGDSVIIWLFYNSEMFSVGREYNSDLPIEEYLEGFSWKVDCISWGDRDNPESPALFLKGE